jgi:hypothetical protein
MGNSGTEAAFCSRAFSSRGPVTHPRLEPEAGFPAKATQQDLARFWQAIGDGALTSDPSLRRWGGGCVAAVRRRSCDCPKISQKRQRLRQKGHSRRVATRDKHLSSGITGDFNDNAINGIVAFWAQVDARPRRL